MITQTKKSTHTPGPWYIRCNDLVGHRHIHGANGNRIVTVQGTGCIDEIQNANASLIAAAPELLLAVKRAYTLESANHGMTSHAHAYQKIIARAEGRE